MTARAAISAAVLGLVLAGCGSAATPPTDSALSVGNGSRVPLTSPEVTVASSSATSSSTGERTVHGIGDSIMVDSTPNLMARLPGITIDAGVGRPVPPGIAVLAAQRSAGTVADVTVFALGTNGVFSADELARVIELTAGHHLVIVTSHCPSCSWTSANNAAVHAACTLAAHCVVADFAALAARNPHWFGPDEIHMAVGGAGADAYAKVVADAVGM